MKSFQTHILERLEQAADQAGCDLLQQAEWGNSGRLIAQQRNPAFGPKFRTVAYLDYMFSGEHNTIYFNGHGGSPRDTSWLFKSTDSVKIGDMLAKWGKLLEAGKRDGKPFEEKVRT